MFVDWRAAVPGQVNDKIKVSAVTFDVGSFEVLGDATGNSAPKTVHARYLLSWDDRSAPRQEAFYDAPPGLYSLAKLNLAARSPGDFTYEIRGTWNDGAKPRAFRIEDSGQVPQIALNLSGRTLAAGGTLSIAIQVDLRDVVGNLDLSKFEEDDGVLELRDPTELEKLRKRLVQAFKVDR